MKAPKKTPAKGKGGKSPRIATPRARAHAREEPKKPDAEEPEFVPYKAVDRIDPRAYVPNDKDRRIIAMAKAHLMTTEQIAIQVGVSETTLKKYYQRELTMGTDGINILVSSNMAKIATSTTDLKAAVSAGKLWLDKFAKLPGEGAGAKATFTRKRGDEDDDDGEIEVYTLELGRLPGLEDDEP